MISTRGIHRAAQRSATSVAVTAVAISANHYYSLGKNALALGAALLLASVSLLVLFRATKSRAALIGYAAVSAWIVFGFGVYKGLWAGVLRLFVGTALASLSTSYPKPFVGPFGFEVSGILMFIGALFVAYYGFAFVAVAWRKDSVGLVARPSGAALWSAGALLIVGFGAAYAVARRDTFVPPPNGVVTIGVIAPVTGPYALLGTSFVQAVRMARADLRDTKYRYELRVEDSGREPAGARAGIRRVVTEERVNGVIGAVSLIGQVTAPFATEARIPHLCVCTVMSIGDGAYNFTHIPSPEAEAVLWVTEARRRGLRRIAILQQDYPSINNHVRALRDEAARRGLRITYEHRFADTTRDFAAIIQAARASGPDVYYVEALVPTLDILGEELREANVTNVASVVAPSLSDRPQLFEGSWYTDSDLADMAFKRRFEAAYPDMRFATHMMPYAYDSFNMIVRAYEQGVNPAVYLRNIRRYAGAAGVFRKRPGSGNFLSTPTVWTIENAKPVLWRESRAAAREREESR